MWPYRAEFRNRDLNSPVIAVQTLHEIEFGFGATRELCLSILSESFRGVDRVTQILKENSRNFREKAPEVEEWKEVAFRTREFRRAVVDRQMTSTAKIIEGLQAKLAKLLDQQSESEVVPAMFAQVVEVDPEGPEDMQTPPRTTTTTTTTTTPSSSSSSLSSSSSTPTTSSSSLTPSLLTPDRGEQKNRQLTHNN